MKGFVEVGLLTVGVGALLFCVQIPGRDLLWWSSMQIVPRLHAPHSLSEARDDLFRLAKKRSQ